jgi:hypothetical protein
MWNESKMPARWYELLRERMQVDEDQFIKLTIAPLGIIAEATLVTTMTVLWSAR